jgi:DNA-binding MarR family transcriptional regulator
MAPMSTATPDFDIESESAGRGARPTDRAGAPFAAPPSPDRPADVRPDSPAEPGSAIDVALERALEELFRLGANKRFNHHQAIAVGAVVTRAGYAALRSLHDHGSLSVRRLADACAMDAATASRQLMPLVDAGLVERRGAESDLRQVVLRLTPRGREVYARIADYRLGQLTSVLETWSEEDRDRLASLVSRLAGDLARLPRESAVRSGRGLRRATDDG